MRNKFLGTGQPGFHPIRKIRVALSGMRYAVVYDFAVAYKTILSILLLIGCYYNRKWIDFSLVLVVTGMMIVSEMFNTAIEALCDFVESRHNEKIKIIKDISAAATGISILIWVVVVVVEMIRLVQRWG
jgi:diacylglycerol kinase (ATP)